MAVTLTSADNALKSVYLGVVANQLNTKANPLLGKIKQSTQDVWGKNIVKLAPFGINGGIGAGTEDGTLPTAAGNKYVQFTTALKNLYGRIEISDKAIRASANNAGAFVNLLNDEMEGLIKASAFNLGRMLYGNSTGLLATIGATYTTGNGYLEVDDTRNIVEGMLLDIYNEGVKDSDASGYRVTFVDRSANKVYLNYASTLALESIAQDSTIYVQGSKDNELTGLGSIFADTTLYGCSKTTYPWLTPYTYSTSQEISESTFQTPIDAVEDACGSEIDFIACSRDVRRVYQKFLSSYRSNIDVMELDGGFKALSYNGIPVYADRFIESGAMYLLNSKDFTLHQLCDWDWLADDNGRIIKQNADHATYSATLVKYADLICDRPSGQAKITNISSSYTSPFVTIASNTDSIVTSQASIATDTTAISTNVATLASGT